MPDTNTQSEVRRRTKRDPRRGQIARLGPTFFFALAVIYLTLLLLIAVGREAEFWFLDNLNDPIAGVLPLGVPWFGALGAVTLSLYGVFDHNDHWNPKWNYWHIARPLVGIILAIIAYFIFITLINSTGLTPRTSAIATTTTTTSSTTSTTLGPTTTTSDSPGTTDSTSNEGPGYVPEPADQEPEAANQEPDGTATSATSTPGQTSGNTSGPSALLLYYVLAFIVGFREDTFRNLIKRAADVLLGPGDPGTPPAGITISPSPVQFQEVPIWAVEDETVTVTNSGTGDLQIYPADASTRGTDISDKNGVFSLTANAVEGATISPGANASLKVQFQPESAGTYTGTLTISSNAGTHPIDIRGEATDELQKAEGPQAQPQRAAGRGVLKRVPARRVLDADRPPGLGGGADRSSARCCLPDLIDGGQDDVGLGHLEKVAAPFGPDEPAALADLGQLLLVAAIRCTYRAQVLGFCRGGGRSSQLASNITA